MIDFGALPPEINSLRIYAGPGPGSLAAAAVMWDSLAAESHAAAGFYRSVISGLTTGRWLGPASVAMASAYGPYVAWTAGVSARAVEAASQARLAVEAYEAAFTMTVPPPAVFANRAQLATLVATNFFGQNSAAIAATEALYSEMWAQDAVAMYEYAANAATACDLTQLISPPEVVNPGGVAAQATSVAAAASPAEQLSLSSIVSSIPSMLSGLASPASAIPGVSGIFSSLNPSSIISDLGTTPIYALPSYFSAAVTPLYALSSIFSIAQTTQSLANTAASAAQGAAAGAANAAAAGAGALERLGSGVAASLGNAASLGPLSVPTGWTSVIPTANNAAAALPNTVTNGATVAPSMLGAPPRAGLAGASQSAGPRYGTVPTVMTRPPSGGYG